MTTVASCSRTISAGRGGLRGWGSTNSLIAEALLKALGADIHRISRNERLVSGVAHGPDERVPAACRSGRAGGRCRPAGTGRIATVWRMAARALADETTPAISPELVDEEVSELRSALALGGAQLADEQEQAMRVACSDRRLTVIVGQAGTGKSTALTGVARAHQAAGRRVIVTSTGAQAAERLTSEFSEAGSQTRRVTPPRRCGPGWHAARLRSGPR